MWPTKPLLTFFKIHHHVSGCSHKKARVGTADVDEELLRQRNAFVLLQFLLGVLIGKDY